MDLLKSLQFYDYIIVGKHQYDEPIRPGDMTKWEESMNGEPIKRRYDVPIKPRPLSEVITLLK